MQSWGVGGQRRGTQNPGPKTRLTAARHYKIMSMLGIDMSGSHFRAQKYVFRMARRAGDAILPLRSIVWP